jgi:hypothetical protein
MITPTVSTPHIVPPDKPAYLLIALLSLWLLGISEAAEGYTSLQILSDPWFAGLDGARAVVEVLLGTMREHYAALLPLNIARLLVGSLLIALSAIAIFSGRLSVSFTVQTLVAVGLLTISAYVVEQPLRVARINALLAEDSFLLQERSELSSIDFEQLRWALERAGLAAQLGLLSLSGFALTRPRVRRFLTHQAARSAQER